MPFNRRLISHLCGSETCMIKFYQRLMISLIYPTQQVTSFSYHGYCSRMLRTSAGSGNKSRMRVGCTTFLQQISFLCQDEVGAALKQFVDLISAPPTKVGILGPFFSNQAQVVAEVARYYHLVQVIRGVYLYIVIFK